MVMTVEQSVGGMAREIEVHGENLTQRRFNRHKSHVICPGLEPGLPWWEVVTNLQSCGAALLWVSLGFQHTILPNRGSSLYIVAVNL
jgi:hypothetical protein